MKTNVLPLSYLLTGIVLFCCYFETANAVCTKFYFETSESPHVDQQPFSATITFKTAASVASSEARFTDVQDVEIQVGNYIVKPNNLHPVASNHKVFFTGDRKHISSFTEETDPPQPSLNSIWLFADSNDFIELVPRPAPPGQSDLDIVVKLAHNQVYLETMLNGPGMTWIEASSTLHGQWNCQPAQSPGCCINIWVVIVLIIIIVVIIVFCFMKCRGKSKQE